MITNALFLVWNSQRSILEQQIKQKRQQAPHIRASDLQIIRSDGNKEAIHAYNGNLFIRNSCGLREIRKSGIKHCPIKNIPAYDIEYWNFPFE